ncbi:MAG: hypothetical protein JNJ77_13960 [Planctomycetia bacterium]|nr:hypothetical protein [Planctomycetia bacterium]
MAITIKDAMHMYGQTMANDSGNEAETRQQTTEIIPMANDDQITTLCLRGVAWP